MRPGEGLRAEKQGDGDVLIGTLTYSSNGSD
jgi:hypothetical protein